MAELAGSIIGIVSAGTKVALVLSQLAADIGSAGEEARMISSEIHTFCLILNTLKDTMEILQTSSYYAHCFDMVQGMTAASIDMFTEVLNAAEILRTMVRNKDGREGKFTFVNKVQWVVFQKPKIGVLRAAIEAYKSNIAMMLGTINIVEKIARRTSYANAPATVVEDDQERATLQSLELDCRSSMISLEQAERLYNEYLKRLSMGQVSPSEHHLHDTSTEMESTVTKQSFPDIDDPRRRLLHMARTDVDSMRSSLKSVVNDQESLQARVSRHSQRLSKLMAEDHRRLSRRWTKLLADEVSLEANLYHENQGPYVQQKPATRNEPANDISFGHFEKQGPYVKFRGWLLHQPWSQQDEILRALRSARHADRVFTDQLSNVNADLMTADKSIRVFDSSRLPKSISPSERTQAWISQQLTHDIVNTILEQLASQSQEASPGNSLSVAREVSLKMREALDLSWNCLQTVPLAFYFYSNLRCLDLRHNRLEVFPPPLLRLSSLVALDLRGNKIRCIPSAISSLKALEILLISDNELQGLPFAIGSMENLKILECHRNPIIFPAPSSFHFRQPGSQAEPSASYSFHTTQTSVLKTCLKQYEMDKVTHTNVQAIAGKLPLHVLATHISSQRMETNSLENRALERIEIEEATTIHEALISLRSGRSATLAESIRVPYEASGPSSRSLIDLKRANNSLASFSAKEVHSHDHRRSRSHDDSSYQGPNFVISSAGILEQPHNPRAPTTEDKSVFSASNNANKTFVQDVHRSMAAQAANRQDMEGERTPTSPKSRLLPQPQLPRALTPRKVKRHSVLFESGPAEQQHDPENSFHEEMRAINSRSLLAQTNDGEHAESD
ncbi:hypothetical protein IQ06DRAFT_126073 [Phaeosphaeriaceae sp. SRC1lsM3a]|nr:hypothetical protein IQ06DRAFT_126073 [Stagonospora sp. SRC1lsM3a]